MLQVTVRKTAILLSKVKNVAKIYFSKVKYNSYVVSDGIDIGHGEKIPLWLFGLLY